MKFILYFVSFVVFIDLLGFTAWALSEQKPYDNFYAGMITASVVHAIK